MAEYARLTGLPEMPPLWSLGYQQSHRTLASRDLVLSIAQTFREKKLPCDVLIYLGTGFCPSGWNTGHGSFSFNPTAFPDPKPMLDELHTMHFHVVPHVVIRARSVTGRASDRFDPGRTDESQAGSYWNAHRGVFSLGVDGWWPDEGDPLDGPSRLARIRMYWEGCQIDRPDQPPLCPPSQRLRRHAALCRRSSGRATSTRPGRRLRTHVPVAINTGLTGIPYWGTDIGGFVPTKELTGELYVRWFQFGAFCPLFRSHGRTWMLRLPWGWNTGELGPNEIRTYGDAANPDPSELHNAAVEPICRKYLELRYRLMPYLYSVVREGCQTGLAGHARALASSSRRHDRGRSRRRVPLGPEHPGRSGDRERCRRRGASTCRAGSGTTSGRASAIEGGREINRPVRPGDHAAVRSRRHDPAAGPRQAIHRVKMSMARSRFRSTPAPTATSWSTKTTASRSPIAPATGWASTFAGTTEPSDCRSSLPRARACARRSSASSRCEMMPDGTARPAVFTGKKLEA